MDEWSLCIWDWDKRRIYAGGQSLFRKRQQANTIYGVDFAEFDAERRDGCRTDTRTSGLRIQSSSPTVAPPTAKSVTANRTVRPAGHRLPTRARRRESNKDAFLWQSLWKLGRRNSACCGAGQRLFLKTRSSAEHPRPQPDPGDTLHTSRWARPGTYPHQALGGQSYSSRAPAIGSNQTNHGVEVRRTQYAHRNPSC